MAVNLRIGDGVTTVCADEKGDFEWFGDTEAARVARQITHDNAWMKGRYVTDELFLARRIARLIGNCEVIDADSIVKSLRDGWVQLLRVNLMSDPNPRERINALTLWRGLACQIETRSTKLSIAYAHAPTRTWPVSGVVNVGDSTVLRFVSQIGKSAENISHPEITVLWERVVCIHFSHRIPTPEIVHENRIKALEHVARPK